MKLYTPAEVTVADSQREKLRTQIDRKYLPVKIVVKDAGAPTHTLLLTRGQMTKIEKARELGRRKYKTIRMSRKQIEKNQIHHGGCLQLFNTVSMTDDNGLYLVKNGHTLKVFPSQENELRLQKHPLLLHETFEDGLYQKSGNLIENADKVVVDENKLPILQWLL